MSAVFTYSCPLTVKMLWAETVANCSRISSDKSGTESGLLSGISCRSISISSPGPALSLAGVRSTRTSISGEANVLRCRVHR